MWSIYHITSIYIDFTYLHIFNVAQVWLNFIQRYQRTYEKVKRTKKSKTQPEPSSNRQFHFENMSKTLEYEFIKVWPLDPLPFMVLFLTICLKAILSTVSKKKISILNKRIRLFKLLLYMIKKYNWNLIFFRISFKFKNPYKVLVLF